MIWCFPFFIGRVCAALLPLCAISQALEVPLSSETHPGPGPGHSATVRGPFANQTLPPHVNAAGGSLTLFADHDHPDADAVPVYLINRGNKRVDFPTYNSDPGMVLEQFDVPSQSWRRAQAGMITSADCGNSFYPLSLAPGQHFRLDGYRPKADARKGRVRFRLDGCDVISNAGSGFWREPDVASVPLDREMIRRQPFGTDSGIWRFEASPSAYGTAEQIVAKLGMMKIWEDGPVFRSFGQALLREMEKPEAKADPTQVEALREMKGLLARKNPPGIQPDALFTSSMEALRGPRKDAYGSASKFPGISWMALAWLRENGGMGWDRRWKGVYSLLMTRLDAASEEEISGMNHMIRGNPLALEYLSGEFLIKTAIANPGLKEACLERLASIPDSKAILKVAEGTDLRTRLKILPYMCLEPGPNGTPYPYMKRGDVETGYLLQCVKDAPWETAYSLYSSMGFQDAHSLPNPVIQAYRDELSRLPEVARTETGLDLTGTDHPGIMQTVRNLGKYARPDDPTLHELRSLENISPEGETDGQKQRRQAIAREARKQLLIAGWDPAGPPDPESR